MTIKIEPTHNFNYDGTTINKYDANKGEGLPMHEHTYPHATMCCAGSCVVRVKGKEIVINGKTKALDLPPNEPHEIEALEDETVFVNVFAERKL